VDYTERSANALDYSCFAFDPLAVGDDQLVHAGWIYSHSPGPGGGCSFDPPDSRPKSGGVNQKIGSAVSPAKEFRAQIYFGGIVMNKDQVKGKVKDVAGRIERQAGEWTGDPEKQVHGALKQAEGKVQTAWGDAKDAGKKAADKGTNKNETADDSAETETEVEGRSRRKAS
jgi:uncharacterized protein YjbJ (UPF0337 family)